MTDYRAFLEAKMQLSQNVGPTIEASTINPALKPHAQLAARWAVGGGRRAIFARFGLHKTSIQLEIMRQIGIVDPGLRLIVLPLGVRQEFRRDADLWFKGDCAVDLKFIRRAEEIDDERTIYLTNYETVRDAKLDPRIFHAASLDEASVLRGFGGTKTFREFMRLFAGDDRSSGIKTDGVKYRFVATATPSPNEYIELLAYAAYLGVMEVSEAKTRFFRRNSEKADHLTIHPHKEREFWLWVASWALFIQRPSDLGFSDDGYTLPELDIRWHELPASPTTPGADRDGQERLFKNTAVGLTEAAREKRDSLDERIVKLLQLRDEDPAAHRLIWHDLEAERHAIEKALPAVVTVYGSQDIEEKESAVVDFSDGRIAELAAKPVMLGSGCNLQRHCAWAIFLGIGFKFNDFIQAIHRLHRFQQEKRVRIDLIYTEAERQVRENLVTKWKQHDAQADIMSDIIREYGLSSASLAGALQRSIGVKRESASGRGWSMVNSDCVEETCLMDSDSVSLVVTSIPFSTQYEYTPSYNDFGHTDDDGHFFEQMDFLTPQLLRVVKPGRVVAVHVKDRITPGGINGFGFQTVSPFSDMTIAHFRKHGFAFLARKTVVTDVVRENNQTYRLGWTEQCKDGSRMGAGLPEYVLLFRKPPSDRSNGYADEPVVKDKREWKEDRWTNEGYSRAKWQLDAHGFTRSSGDRLLSPEDLTGLPADQVYKRFRNYSMKNVYDFGNHVAIAERLEEEGCLPPTFMLLPPASWHPDVWTDITRMRTLNGAQSAAGKEMHLCPLQFDIVDRLIAQFSMPGEAVFDPFAGLGTVPLCAVKAGRVGWGIELNDAYFADSLWYLRAAEREAAMPRLFDLDEAA